MYVDCLGPDGTIISLPLRFEVLEGEELAELRQTEDMEEY